MQKVGRLSIVNDICIQLTNKLNFYTMKTRNQFFEEIKNGFDLSTLNLEDMSRAELIELAYSLDWNGDWDTDDDGNGDFPPITKEELVNSIKSMIEEGY